MYKKLFKGLFSLLLLLQFSCSTESILPMPDNAGSNYFPLEVGQFAIYNVMDVNINLSGRDTARYLLRETIIDYFQNQADTYTYRISRERDNQDGTGWRMQSISTIQKTNQHIRVTEDNLPILKLVFPLKEGVVWDGNSFNGNFRAEFSATFLQSGLNIDGHQYDSVVKVIQADIPENLTGIDQKYEFYAPGIGLVSKDFTTLRYCTRNCSAQFIIEGGRVLKQNLVSYGKS